MKPEQRDFFVKYILPLIPRICLVGDEIQGYVQ
jgi:hypothetical protein